jgi:hypothetical protein
MQTYKELIAESLSTSSNNPVIISSCYKVVTHNLLEQLVTNMLTQRPCSCASWQLVNKPGRSSANTSFWQVVGIALLQVCFRFVTSCSFLHIQSQPDLRLCISTATRAKISQQLVNNMCACLFVPSCWKVWNKLLSFCYKVDEANRLATSCPNQSDIVCTQQVDAWQQARSNLLRTACISLVGTTCIKSVTVNQPCNKVITTCFKLITTTGNKQCEHIEWATTLSQQPCYNLLADL